jgi:hypothetical protein
MMSAPIDKLIRKRGIWLVQSKTIWAAAASDRRAWHAAMAHGLPVAGLVLGLTAYWFGVADRHIVFLYYHNMGAHVPDTSPFSPVTSSRYWMSGLVAGGAVLVLYTLVNWLVGRVKRGYRPPDWWRVWAVAAVPLLIGIPWITMTVNWPTLPLMQAARVTLVALLGVGLALPSGKWAAERPSQLFWLIADGWGLAGILFCLSLLEQFMWALDRGNSAALFTMGVGLIGAAVLLLFVTGVRAWRRIAIPPAMAMFVAGLGVAHLLLPLLHHVVFTQGYFYITNSNNFFADHWGLQLVAWLITAALAGGITRLRHRLADWAANSSAGKKR